MKRAIANDRLGSLASVRRHHGQSALPFNSCRSAAPQRSRETCTEAEVAGAYL